MQKKPSVFYDTKERFVILSIGRLSTQKGFDLAVQAASLLKQRGKNFLWIIIGEGAERLQLEFLIERYGLKADVILHGFDENPYAYLNIADLYVQTSRYEGFSTAISEAIIARKPIVTTVVSGVDNQVYEGRNGLLSSFDSGDLADKIQKMIDDEEFRLMMAKGSAEVVLPMDKTLAVLDSWFMA